MNTNVNSFQNTGISLLKMDLFRKASTISASPFVNDFKNNEVQVAWTEEETMCKTAEAGKVDVKISESQSIVSIGEVYLETNTDTSSRLLACLVQIDTQASYP